MVLVLAAVSVGAWGLDSQEQLVRLDTHLEKIRQEYEFGRLMGGSTLVGIGGLIGVGGSVAVWSVTSGLSNQTAEQARNLGIALSWTYGGLFIVPGALVLALKTDYETMPEQYAKLASGTETEAATKIIRGEVTLQSLADKARFERYLSAGLLGLAGVGLLSVNYNSSAGRTGSSTANPAMLSGALYLGAGILRALLDSTPENENRAYLRWKSTT